MTVSLAINTVTVDLIVSIVGYKLLINYELMVRIKFETNPIYVNLFIYLLFYVAFKCQGHIATGSLQVEETSAYCTVNHQASASNYQLSNMKRPARDSNRRPQRLEARTLTATPLTPPPIYVKANTIIY